MFIPMGFGWIVALGLDPFKLQVKSIQYIFRHKKLFPSWSKLNLI